MQDEQFIRDWTKVHESFTGSLAGALARPGKRRKSRREAIASAYEGPILPRAPATALSPAAKASLRGLAATVLTVTLWVTVMALATPAPGLASPPDAMERDCDCVASLALA